MQTSADKNIYLNGLLASIVLVVLVGLPYFQVRNHEFVDLDDYDYLVENHHIKNGLTVDGLVWAFSFQKNDNSYWRPLAWVSHMVDFEFSGNDAGRHHISNLLLHVFNTLLLFVFFVITTGRSFGSFLAAALFAIHPINVESVAWVTERSNVLCTFAGLITMLLYVWYTLHPSLSRYLFVVLFLIICLMVKPILVTLPFLLLLLDFWPLNRFGDNSLGKEERIRRIWKLFGEKIPLIALCFITIWISLHRQGGTISVEQISIPLRLSNAAVAYVRYLINLFYPLNLTAFYPFPKTIPMWQTLGAVFVLMSVSVVSLIRARAMPYLFVGWFWFAGTMFPKIGLVQAGLWPALADRWAYFPAIGLFIVISWLCGDFLKKRPTISKRQMAFISLLTCGALCFL
ncbi:MAG: hypothetical protein V2J65_32400, partial [Desulfobacteraceae bacterium]|nr:hypothetical protein [Desulfobacteraceae bacterium]